MIQEPDIADVKDRLRHAVRERRRQVTPEQAAKAGRDLAQGFARHCVIPAKSKVSAYWPSRYEIDPRPLMEMLSEAGHQICLPVVVERDQPLIFRVYRAGDALVRGNGAMVPDPSALEIEPNVLLVPLVAFDRQGGRLGQGAGYYDRTLERLRERGAVQAIGIAYALQEVDAVPLADYDQSLDGVLTESGYFPRG
jgi:5-formyltetrahydrofolate cyclo-ligase